MKIWTSLLLLGALMALSQAAAFPEDEAAMKETLPEDEAGPAMKETLPEDEAGPAMKETLPEDEAAMKETLPEDEAGPAMKETLPEDEAGPAMKETLPEVILDVEKRSCQSGWTKRGNRCFRFYPAATSWSAAQSNCRSARANLASIHSSDEYHFVQSLITAAGHRSKEAWLGGSDAHREGRWLWTDGRPFLYSHWCRGEPNNLLGKQHCLLMNFGGSRCWDDVKCADRRSYVCAKNL